LFYICKVFRIRLWRIPTESSLHGGQTIRTAGQNKRFLPRLLLFIEMQLIVSLKMICMHPTLVLCFQDGETAITEVPCLPLTHSTQLVWALLTKDSAAVLLQKQHNHLNTMLDLTRVAPYALLFFDEQREFISATFSLSHGEAPFALQTQAHYIALLPYPCDFNFNTLTHLQIENPC